MDQEHLGNSTGWLARPSRVMVVSGRSTGTARLARVLRNDGHDVCIANTGQAALDLIAEDPVHLVLVAAWLPHPDTATLCRKLKERNTCCRIPIILLVKKSHRRRIPGSLLNEINDVMVLPAHDSELRIRVRTALKYQNAVEQLFQTKAKLEGRLEQSSQTVQESAERYRLEALSHRKTRKRIEQLVAAIPSILIRVDRQGRILDWNRIAERILGISDADAIGRKICDLNVWLAKDIEGLVGSSARSRKPVTAEIPYSVQNGISGYLGITVCPIRAGNLSGLEFLVFGQEITKRKEYKDALQLRTELHQALNSAMTAFLGGAVWKEVSKILLSAALAQSRSAFGFVGVVKGGAVLQIDCFEGIEWSQTENRAFFEGAQKLYQEQGFLEFTNLDTLFGRVIKSRQSVLANDPAHAEGSSGTPKGHPSLSAFLGVPILRKGEVLGMIGVANAPSGYSPVEQERLEFLAQTAGVLYESYLHKEEQERLGHELRQAQKMEAIGQMAGGIAHEFNNLMTIVVGYSNLLLDRMPTSDSNRVHIQAMKTAGERATSVTRQLLLFSRKERAQPENFDLEAAFSELQHMLRPMVPESIDLRVKCDAQGVAVNMDRSQFQLLLLNLAVNARDAMPDGGRLDVSAIRTDRNAEAGCSEIRISVADTGTGIPKENIARIFEPFFTTKKAGKGTGLGLSTVYGIVQQAGGRIHVDSEPGKGSRFDVHLPICFPEKAAVPEKIPPTKSSQFKGTILLVEDEEQVRDLAKRYLEDAGITVLVAPNGLEAVKLIARKFSTIDCLVTDMVMPQLGGKELADRLLAAKPDARILFISGYSDELARLERRNGSKCTYLRKPFTQDELIGMIQELCAD